MPPPLGFYSCTAEYLTPGAAPLGAAPSFIFLTKKKDKRRAGGRWWHAAVCLLCSWGSAWHGRRGSHRAPAAPFGSRARVPPSPLPQGHWGGLAQPEGLGGRAEPCRAVGQLALVSVPAAGALPQLRPATLGTAPASPSQPGTRGGWQSGTGWQALPSPACSEPFSSQMLYMK